VSLLGGALRPPELPDDVRATYEANLAAAERELAADPEDADALIWYGRRLAYLGRYRDAIDVYTRAIGLHPGDARLYRHRGHRWITVREPGLAVADLRHAVELVAGTQDEVEPDGVPNERGIPTSTLHFNIWYHLGLAHYLRGDFVQALLAWNECMAVSRHPDSVVATAYWLNNVLRRLDLDARADSVLADIDAGMDIIESTSYLDVLLLWKGERTPEQLRSAGADEGALASVTTEYGIGMWRFARGRRERAYELWESILEREGQWAAFGSIAAEAELARVDGEG
jgi:tetratricopeptide (TPR) repeat protein